MPGIVGLLTSMPRELAEPQLLRMVDALHHEDFHATGTWIDEASGVYVGWTVRKNSFADGMPVRDPRGDVVLVFSGEEFGESRPATDAGDLSYLLGVYETDPAFPAGLNGRFHGLLTDRRHATSTLFNDRYGMHRLYYHQTKDAFYFAAEAKAILEVRPESRKIDRRGASEFLACGSTLEGRSLFDGVHVLPGGARWSFHRGSLLRRATYFEPKEWEELPRLEPEPFYREVREVFARNLPRYFEGREPIAMSLTGGLDTRIIMAWRKSEPGTLPCYTFGGMLRDSRDVLVARHVASVCGQPHEVISVGGDFLSNFPYYAERSVYITDGCVDVGRAPDLYLNERARHVAPVRMTGNYGGEVLRRVRAFKPVEPVSGLFEPEFLAYRLARDTYATLLAGHPLSFAVFKQGPWHHYGVLALEETQLSLRSPYLDNDLVRTLFRGPESALASNDVSLRLIADGDAALSRIQTDRGIGGRGRLAEVTARTVHELLFKAEYAYDMGMPQWAARVDHRLARLRLERLFLGRHKLAHFRVWYRGALSGYLRDVLLDRRALARPYLDRTRLRTVVESHIRGDRNYTADIHKLLTLELVHRLFIDTK